MHVESKQIDPMKHYSGRSRNVLGIFGREKLLTVFMALYHFYVIYAQVYVEHQARRKTAAIEALWGHYG
jgi:hypothetical protein